MIEEVTGIKKIRMLYLQLLYRCNFTCLHCFHGKRLQYADAFTVDEAADLLTLMRDEYGTEAVTLLGGEPFVHRDLAQVVRHAKEELGLRVEICTNGYRIERRLTEIAPSLDLLRVSLEGVVSTNDGIRKQGSYQSALEALGLARDLGVPTGATMTVTSRNIAEVLPLGRALAELGVRQLKLHHLRPVGNAADHPELLVTSPSAYGRPGRAGVSRSAFGGDRRRGPLRGRCPAGVRPLRWSSRNRPHRGRPARCADHVLQGRGQGRARLLVREGGRTHRPQALVRRRAHPRGTGRGVWTCLITHASRAWRDYAAPANPPWRPCSPPPGRPSSSLPSRCPTSRSDRRWTSGRT